MDGTSKLYIGHVLGMVEDGHWGIPHLDGQEALYKPPLYLWLVAGSHSLLGSSISSTVLPNLLILLALAYGMFSLVSTITIDRQRGLFAALGYTLSAGVYYNYYQTQMDLALTAMMIWSTLFVYRYAESNRPSQWAAAMALAGLCSMIKSPIYSVLLVFSSFLYLRLKIGDTHWLRRSHIWGGLGVGVAVTLPWYGYAAIMHWDHFWNFFVLQEHVFKGRSGHFWEMFVNTAWFSLPWSLVFLIPGVYRGIRDNPANKLFLCFALPLLVLFSVHTFSKPRFALPVAFYVVMWVFVQHRFSKAWHGATVTVLVVLTVLLLSFGHLLHRDISAFHRQRPNTTLVYYGDSYFLPLHLHRVITGHTVARARTPEELIALLSKGNVWVVVGEESQSLYEMVGHHLHVVGVWNGVMGRVSLRQVMQALSDGNWNHVLTAYPMVEKMQTEVPSTGGVS